MTTNGSEPKIEAGKEFWSAIEEYRMEPVDLPAKLIVKESIYYRNESGEECIEDLSRRYLETKEQAYKRITSVGSDWEPLDLGWLKDSKLGLVYLKNNSESETLHFGFSNDYNDGYSSSHWVIPPTESFRGLPSDPYNLQVRSASENRCPYTWLVVPG